MERCIAGLRVELTRKRIKNLRLTVHSPDGAVRISAPLNMPERVIEDFVRSKLSWISAQQRRIAARPEAALICVEDGGRIYLWGKAYTLHIAGGRQSSLIIEDDGTALLTVREGSTPEMCMALIKQWYRRELKDAAAVYLPKWERISGLHASSWQIKDMKTRWGTCNVQSSKIWLSLRLAQYPPECLEYVIMHELAHLAVPNHGAEFKALLDRFMPDWRERQKILRG